MFCDLTILTVDTCPTLPTMQPATSQQELFERRDLCHPQQQSLTIINLYKGRHSPRMFGIWETGQLASYVLNMCECNVPSTRIYTSSRAVIHLMDCARAAQCSTRQCHRRCRTDQHLRSKLTQHQSQWPRCKVCWASHLRETQFVSVAGMQVEQTQLKVLECDVKLVAQVWHGSYHGFCT